MEYIGIQKKNGGVVEALQQAILSGQIPAGTEMTQNELAESLGVSRMPVSYTHLDVYKRQPLEEQRGRHCSDESSPAAGGYSESVR